MYRIGNYKARDNKWFKKIKKCFPEMKYIRHHRSYGLVSRRGREGRRGRYFCEKPRTYYGSRSRCGVKVRLGEKLLFFGGVATYGARFWTHRDMSKALGISGGVAWGHQGGPLRSNWIMYSSGFRGGGGIHSGCELSATRDALKEFLTINGVPFKKSWNKLKLIKAFMSL